MLAAAAAAAALGALSPVVVEDSRERFPLSSVAAAPVPVPGVVRGGAAKPVAYGRVAPASGGGNWVQYWLFYPGQDQDRGIVRTGRHAGDWEMVQYRLDARGSPVQAVYAQHSGAERCAWRDVERRYGRPMVYAARGSHASYLRAGVRDRIWPNPNDEANGRGRTLRTQVVPITAHSPPWMRWPGRWGGARARWWVPGEQDSPPGPAFQGQGRWSDPERWAREARPCAVGCARRDRCDGAETALGVAAISLPAGALLLEWRRRRRRRPG